ncbi:MAG: hypothetical protein HY364_00790 [Candidatus Aenigmarchaeota archaeon]|nr:hypothetical protein [Candidatus Aenigmarchaeota archaeon]
MKFYLVTGIVAGFLAIYALSIVTGNAVAEAQTHSLPRIPEPVIEERFYHAHADFKVFIDGNEMDFARKKYDYKDHNIHLHINNPYGGYVMHLEGGGAELANFFASLGMIFNSTCFATETESYCNTGFSKLRMLVNGKENQDYGSYIPQDLDRILVTYGNQTEEEISSQKNSITSVSCAFSGVCAIPEELVGVELL